MDFDRTLTGGLVVDGTGARAYRADVGLRRGRIEAIGDLATYADPHRVPGGVEHVLVAGEMTVRDCGIRGLGLAACSGGPEPVRSGPAPQPALIGVGSLADTAGATYTQWPRPTRHRKEPRA